MGYCHIVLERISRSEAEDLLKHCLEDGEVQAGPHFREALADERLTYADALAVLRNGMIYEEPEQDIRIGDWKYRMEGREPGGQRVAIVFTFRTLDEAFLITIFSIERGGKRE